MNILGCLDSPSEGSYRLDGIDVSTLEEDNPQTYAIARSGSCFSPST
jgi:putative ABC transport system ATP-binding protein